MTLRVTLEILPGGVEENKRTLHTIDISNIGTIRVHQEYGEECEYSVTHNEEGRTETLRHWRRNGALALAEDAINLVDEGHVLD